LQWSWKLLRRQLRTIFISEHTVPAYSRRARLGHCIHFADLQWPQAWANQPYSTARMSLSQVSKRLEIRLSRSFNLSYVLMGDSHVFCFCYHGMLSLFVLLTCIVVDAAHFTSVNTSNGIVTGHSALYGSHVSEYCHGNQIPYLVRGPSQNLLRPT
jgi:hypothetical protein